MAYLISIPNELKDAVFTEVDRWDVLSLSETCKELHTTATPALYHKIVMFWDVEEVDKTPKIRARWGPNSRMIKTYNFRVVSHCPTAHGETEAALFEKAIEEMELPQKERWKKAITRDNDVGAMIALLLARCTDLQSLKIALDVLYGYEWSTTMLRHAIIVPGEVKRSSNFNRLVNVVEWGPSLGRDRLQPFPYPKENLLAAQLAESYANGKRPFWPLHHPPVGTNLATLELIGEGHAPIESAAVLLKLAPKLTTLEYNIQLDGTGRLALGQLQRRLHHLRNTLSYLIITYQFDVIESEVSDSNSIDAVGFLRDFTALTCLHVPLAILFGPMPPCHWDTSDSDDNDLWDIPTFESWMKEPLIALLKAFFDEEFKIATPQLRKVVLDLRDYWAGQTTYWCKEATREELR
ncbi:uncharacterized protein BDZ99DRAFT_524350 [Mytilinidion resinicola]|uniref:F-box domain-containing protein n=1 Tax=Mytilinidion resinicola TaxID=574789 RepID=A0A6A6YDF5_9PEZI|nr:uncharacterized protein BDZ99DRAFT_524350 [Mytilinidion resinicola]KAF2806125.1 hypothetical protein BDZ99DRAFT_524350 [Mytilinidion resinicola]